MKVALLTSDEPHDAHAFVARIRVVEPLRAVAREHPLQLRWCDPGEQLPDADVLLLQRAPFASIEQLERQAARIERARRSGTRVVWELDDHLFCDDLRTLIEASAIDEVDDDAYELVQAHRALLPLADAFVCSTEPLRAALLPYVNAPVHVIPVALDFEQPRWNGTVSPREGAPVIGWSGGSRVGRDLEQIAPAVRELLARHRTMRFLLAGSLKYAPLFAGIDRVELVPWTSYDHYPALLARTDVALLPMEEHAYNRCKSALKAIDYGAMGVPSVCSDATPFCAAREEVGAFATTTKEWIDGVERLLQISMRERDALRRRIRARHDVRSIVPQWWSAISASRPATRAR